MTTYIKSENLDFGGNVNIGALYQQIENEGSITTTINNINKNGDVVKLNFSADLSASELTSLDTLISNYVYLPVFIGDTSNIQSTSDPTVDDDDAHGYPVGSKWFNSTSNELFILFNNTIGSALWKKIGNNIVKTSNPNSSDDKSKGYEKGTKWTNTIEKSVYVMTEDSEGSAVWKNISDKGYDAIVSMTGNDDYTSIASAFAAGATTVFVRAGLYIETADIVLPDGGVLIGEGPNRVVINFDGGAYSIKIDATNGSKETTGNISITSGTTSVTGTGTTFTNLSVGQFILLGQTFYEISSITDNTNLTIADTYKGKKLTNYTYQAHALYSGVSMCNFIVAGSISDGIFVRGTRHSIFSCIASKSCVTSFHFEDSSSNSIANLASQNTFSHGIRICDCYAVSLESVTSFNSSGNGINIEGSSNSILVANCQSANNVGIGFNMIDNSSDTLMSGCISKHNGGDALHVGVNSESCNITDCIFKHNSGSGVNLVGLNNTIQGSIISDNTLNGISSSNNNNITANHTFDNLQDGILLTGNNCRISDNNIHDNGQYGVALIGDDNVLTANSVESNSSDGIYVNGGSRNTITSNRISNNTLAGVNILGTSTQVLLSSNIIHTHTYNVDIASTVTSCSVSMNLCHNATNDGIRCAADVCIIGMNRCINNNGYGINITSDSNSTLSLSNHLDGNTSGTELDNGTFPVLNPIKGIYLAKSDAVSIDKSTDQSAYTTVSSFLYAGSFNNHSPVSYQVAAYMDSSATDYSIRVYDVTNSLKLAEATGLTNTSVSIIDLGTISNIPTSTAILEVQLKINNVASEQCHIKSLLTKYY